MLSSRSTKFAWWRARRPPVVRSCLFASCADMLSSRSTGFTWWKARQPLRLEIVPDFRQFWIQCFARHAFRSLREIRLAESMPAPEAGDRAKIWGVWIQCFARHAFWSVRSLAEQTYLNHCLLCKSYVNAETKLVRHCFSPSEFRGATEKQFLISETAYLDLLRTTLQTDQSIPKLRSAICRLRVNQS